MIVNIIYVMVYREKTNVMVYWKNKKFENTKRNVRVSWRDLSKYWYPWLNFQAWLIRFPCDWFGINRGCELISNLATVDGNHTWMIHELKFGNREWKSNVDDKRNLIWQPWMKIKLGWLSKPNLAAAAKLWILFMEPVRSHAIVFVRMLRNIPWSGDEPLP